MVQNQNVLGGLLTRCDTNTQGRSKRSGWPGHGRTNNLSGNYFYFFLFFFSWPNQYSRKSFFYVFFFLNTAIFRQFLSIPLGSLNVGTMTGRGREFADMMEIKGWSAVCVGDCLEVEHCEIVGEGASCSVAGKQATVEWSGLVLSRELKDNLISVSRKSDQVMSIWLTS